MKPILSVYLILALVGLGPLLVRAQSVQEDIAHLLEKRPAGKVFNIKSEAPLQPFEFGRDSELKVLLRGALRTYQVAISSQDMPTCNFVPSCSRFSNLAFQKTGVLRAILLTSDRLQRCNGLPNLPGHYRFLPSLGKFSDPIERYVPPRAPETDDD